MPTVGPPMERLFVRGVAKIWMCLISVGCALLASTLNYFMENATRIGLPTRTVLLSSGLMGCPDVCLGLGLVLLDLFLLAFLLLLCMNCLFLFRLLHFVALLASYQEISMRRGTFGLCPLLSGGILVNRRGRAPCGRVGVESELLSSL